MVVEPEYASSYALNKRQTFDSRSASCKLHHTGLRTNNASSRPAHRQAREALRVKRRRWTDDDSPSSPMTWIETWTAPDLSHLQVPVIAKYLLNLTFTACGGDDNQEVRSWRTASSSALKGGPGL